MTDCPANLDSPVREIADPDEAAAAAARKAVTSVEDAGSVGRLGELAAWAAGVQGGCPPRRFGRIRLLPVLEANGEYAPAARMDELAARCGASVRPLPVAAGDHEAAYRTAAAAVDEEVDGGTDLIVAATAGAEAVAPAVAVVATLTGEDPVSALGWPTDVIAGTDGTVGTARSRVDDDGWMRTVAAARDILRRTRPCAADPRAVLREAGDVVVAALTGILVQAAVRRTPVLLDGLTAGAAALLAQELAPGAAQWWLGGHRSPWPAHRTALARLELDPLTELGITRGDGLGALLGLPMLQAAVELLGSAPAGPPDSA